MSSSSIFACCKSGQSVDRSETTYSIKYRSAIDKSKLMTSIHSPKASLKSLINFKSSKTLENSHKLRETNLTSTIDTCQAIKKQKVPPVSRNFHHSDRQINVKTITPSTINNSVIRQCAPPSKVSKQKVVFSFVNPSNPENQRQSLPASIRNIKGTFKDQNLILTIQHLQTSESLIKQQKKIKENTFPKLSKINKSDFRGSAFSKSNFAGSKVLLGGSKFTILSEGELQQHIVQKEPRMEESAIILNVFKAPQSQVQIWATQTEVQNKNI